MTDRREVRMLVSASARGAYFDEYLRVAIEELCTLVPGAAPKHERVGPFDFIALSASDDQLPALARASFVHGLFATSQGGLQPLETVASFDLPADFVFGSKYQGKTNERVTQLAINAALAFCDRPARTLLDPMAGQGTTLLWAIRYGLSARGIELEASALDALHRHVKKQTKLHRVKHRHSTGFTGARNRADWGKFVRYEFDGTYLQLIAGDSSKAGQLLGGQRFDVAVADLPYGVQFKGKGPRSDILESVRACAPAWVSSVRAGGSLALVFNRYRPKRDALIDVFLDQGCQLQSFEAPHRMSESIVRDIVVFTRPPNGARGDPDRLDES